MSTYPATNRPYAETAVPSDFVLGGAFRNLLHDGLIACGPTFTIVLLLFLVSTDLLGHDKADNLCSRVSWKPLRSTLCATIRQYINDLAALKVTENRAVPVLLAPGPVVASQSVYLRRERSRHQAASERDGTKPTSRRLLHSWGLPREGVWCSRGPAQGLSPCAPPVILSIK
jgi:hypothetical protein